MLDLLEDLDERARMSALAPVDVDTVELCLVELVASERGPMLGRSAADAVADEMVDLACGGSCARSNQESGVKCGEERRRRIAVRKVRRWKSAGEYRRA